MLALALCLLLQEGPSETARKAFADLSALFEVESQHLGTMDQIEEIDLKIEAARLRGDNAGISRLDEQREYLDRRSRAEMQEWVLKGRGLAAAIEQGLRDAPGDTGLLEAHVLLFDGAPGRIDAKRISADVDALAKGRPGHPPYLVMKAALLRLEGSFQEAAGLLTEALKADPGNGRAHAYLGLICCDLLDFAAAREHLKLATDARPSLRPGLAWRVARALREEEIRAKEREKDDLPRVEIVTAKGRLVVELFENEAPNTVANFIQLVEKKFYDGLKFHRVEPKFVVQGGDPRGDGAGGPGYRFADEIYPGYRRHFRGSISMANSGRDTNGSQFFVALCAAEHLDGRHTVFGRVLEGMDAADRMEAGDVVRSARVIRKRDHEYRVRTLGP